MIFVEPSRLEVRCFLGRPAHAIVPCQFENANVPRAFRCIFKDGEMAAVRMPGPRELAVFAGRRQGAVRGVLGV